MDHLGPRRNRGFDALVQIVEARRRHRKRELAEHDAVAALALQPSGDHARIILVGGDHFVAGFQIQAELYDLERLRRIARDRDLLRIAPERARQAPPHGFEAWIENPPHIICRIHILHLEQADFGVHHHLGRG